MVERVLIATVCLALGLLTTAPVLAQVSPTETEARAVFAAGEVAFSDGRYAAALRYFQQAYELSHRPALLFNVALCEDRLRDDDAAIEHYERYIAEVPAAANRGEVDDRLEALHAARARRRAAAQAVEPAYVAEAGGTATSPRTARVVARRAANDTTHSSPAVYETWWFWTIVGVLVVGGAVGIGVAASGDAPLPQGDLGGVVFTLAGGR